jgi:DNA-binding FadR family transcriptional regulator
MIVAQRIVEGIDRRGLRAGNRLPAEQAMLEEYQVGRAALREALRVLEDRGLVELRQGRTCLTRPSSRPGRRCRPWWRD